MMYWDKKIIEKDSNDDLYKIITEPPCRYCEHFYPHRRFDSLGKYQDITLCHNKKIFKDFSCFKPKKEKE